jgi:hypothetical protein
LNLEFALETPNFAMVDENRRRWWPMRPNTGIFWADMLWIIVVAAVDNHIFPAVTGSTLPFMFMTPWLVVTFVVAPIHTAFFALILGGLALETSCGAPRGMYLTAYWVIFATLILCRKTLSWRHAVPWIVTFFFSSFFISNFETLVIFLHQNPEQLDFFHFAKQVVRVTLCVIIGMALAQPWMARFKGESPST